MKIGGFKISEWRYGRIGIWWDLQFWGVGIDVGSYRNDRYQEIIYRAYSIKLTLGPVEVEAAVYLPPGKLLDVGGYQGEWTR